MGRKNKSRQKQPRGQRAASSVKRAASDTGNQTAKTAHNLNQRKPWKRSHVIGALGVIVGGITLAVMGGQWWDSRRSHLVVDSIQFNVIDRELPPESNGRVTVFNYYNNTVKVAAASVSVVKTGNSSPVNAQAFFQCKFVGPDSPLDIDPFQSFQWNEGAAARYVVGPSPAQIPACDLLEGNAMNAKMNMVRAYLLGEVRYTDINGTAHVTQLAHQILVERDTFADFKASTNPVGRHNCSDNCPEN